MAAYEGPAVLKADESKHLKRTVWIGARRRRDRRISITPCVATAGRMQQEPIIVADPNTFLHGSNCHGSAVAEYRKTGARRPKFISRECMHRASIERGRHARAYPAPNVPFRGALW